MRVGHRFVPLLKLLQEADCILHRRFIDLIEQIQHKFQQVGKLIAL